MSGTPSGANRHSILGGGEVSDLRLQVGDDLPNRPGRRAPRSSVCGVAPTALTPTKLPIHDLAAVRQSSETT
jgi:hypothetical protein